MKLTRSKKRADLPVSGKLSPLMVPATVLSSASLAWTSWSLVDLIGTGLIGVTVAAGADVVWGSVIVAEARGLRLADRRWTVFLLGWATLLAVAGFLAWNGVAEGSAAMAAAGPFLPLGAKIVWALALADMRDPAAISDEERAQLAVMERGLAFEEAQHRMTMRHREMEAELRLAEVSVDFHIELSRQDKARELNRRRPLSLDGTPDSVSVPMDRTDRTVPEVSPWTAGQSLVSVPRDSGQRTVPDADLSGRLSHRAFVRGLLSADPGLSNTELSAAVRSEYGQDTKADSITKAISRARGDLARTA